MGRPIAPPPITPSIGFRQEGFGYEELALPVNVCAYADSLELRLENIIPVAFAVHEGDVTPVYVHDRAVIQVLPNERP